MKYYSTNGKAPMASFKEAVFKGLPNDNGLYMPEKIHALPSSFWSSLNELTLPELGSHILKSFTDGEIPDAKLKDIVSETLNFEIPLRQISDNIFCLELFHGPTFAFKDVGARFLARTLAYFSEQKNERLTVLVATSGDTGSAVAQGFYDVPNIDVVILYPSGKISAFQKQQMTTLGKNITALEVNGNFDDCQLLVKKAFLDTPLNKELKLTSANSINIARMLPQSIYYFYGMAQLPENKRSNVVFSVPSGNYGNLTAGLIAQKMGLPVKHFLACSNSNDTVPKYLETSRYEARESIQTISNAMDVGDPSNFARMLDLYSGSHQKMQENITGYSYSDDETKKAIKNVFSETGYILDPHGAIGYLGLRDYLKTNSGTGIFLETAHPGKFRETVETQINQMLDSILEFDDKESKSIPISGDYDTFRSFLLETKTG